MLNSSKPKTMIVLLVTWNFHSLASIQILDENIEFVSTVSSFRFNLHFRLSVEDHINFSVMYCHYTLRKLWFSSSYVPMFTWLNV
uniref:Hypothetical secreted protein n=1 Tax=Glossina morsitans morsitans TaxID=37546 RepID=D3TS07_GLOMM